MIRLLPGLLALCFCSSWLKAEDWPHFRGPNLNFHSSETGLSLIFPPEGPKKLWEVERGKGHSGPVVAKGKLVFIHQVKENEVIQCLDAETGKEIWQHSYPVKVEQSYGISDTPRSSPTIDVETGTVYSFGNDSDLIALNLEDGKILWEIKTFEKFGKGPFFFGQGSSPLVLGEKLIVHVGAPDVCVAALNKKTGETIWTADSEWHGSYASPVTGIVNGKTRLFVFAGGKTEPPEGGLLCIDPENGKVDDAISWRSDMFASVNAASPVPCGENRVFISEDYGKGGALIEFDDNFQGRVVWSLPEFGCQFQTPIYHQGVIYGLGGNGGLLMGVEVSSGVPRWNESFYDTTILWEGREIPISLGHAHLIHVDGEFLCLGENGDLLRLSMNSRGYTLLGKSRLFYAPETWAPPVISNGRLYVNQNEMGSRLICYDVRSK